MPYEQSHPFDTPPDETVLWRYMDFIRFVDLLETSQLYFSGLDELRDRWEGYFGETTVATLLKKSNALPDDEKDKYLLGVLDLLKLNRKARGNYRVSCWHASEHESDAMWRLYLKSNEGIAVRTTVGRMKRSFDRFPHTVHIGRVSYGATMPIPSLSVLHKRSSFEHEREIRACILHPAANDGRVEVVLSDLRGNGVSHFKARNVRLGDTNRAALIAPAKSWDSQQPYGSSRLRVLFEREEAIKWLSHSGNASVLALGTAKPATTNGPSGRGGLIRGAGSR